VSAEIIEYAVYGSPGELPDLPDVRAAAGTALVEVSTSEIADDWSERWREFHRPLVLDGRLTVRPPWEPAGTTPIDLVIDPGQAFGTGAHATTRLCLELLIGLAQRSDFGAGPDAVAPRAIVPIESPPGRFGLLDLGCGSGVLAIAASRLGWDPVLAVDYDALSVAATVANARVNGVSIEVRRHDLRTEATPPAETVCANLLGPLLIEWSAMLGSGPGVALPRRVIASGLLAYESERVTAAFHRLGFAQVDRRVRGEWAALLLER
jgi:ribosomal protein L11 methyltransferase